MTCDFEQHKAKQNKLTHIHTKTYRQKTNTNKLFEMKLCRTCFFHFGTYLVASTPCRTKTNTNRKIVIHLIIAVRSDQLLR